MSAFPAPSLRLTAGLIAALAFGTMAQGQNRLDEKQALPFNQLGGSRFGQDCALDGDRAAVSAPSESVGRKTEAGAVYLYQRVGDAWQLELRLVEPTAVQGNRFGHSIGLDGDRLVVSSIPDGSTTGSAYVYSRAGGSWALEQILGLSAPDGFGFSVDISGAHCVVGRYVGGANATGEAQIFELQGTTWTSVGTVAPSDGANSDWFGLQVAIQTSGTAVTVLAGSPRHNAERGAAYLFGRDTSGSWVESRKFAPVSLGAGDRFGSALDLEPFRVLVGAPYHDDVYADDGVAFLFRFGRGTWSETRLEPSVSSSSGYFGSGLAMDGGTIVVGAQIQFHATAHVFRQIGVDLVEQHMLRSSTTCLSVFRGCAVDGSRILVGAPTHDQPSTDCGAALVHEVSPVFLSTPPWSVDTGWTLHFHAGGLPAQKTGYLALNSIDGLNFFRILLHKSSDAQGAWSFSATVPNVPSLSGHELGFLLLAPQPGVGLAASNESFVSFQ